MPMRPRFFQAQPVTQGSFALSFQAPQNIRVQPVFRTTAWDFIGTEPWVHWPTPIMGLTVVEGTDYPFFTRTTLDDYWDAGVRLRREERDLVQPEQPGVALALTSPPDETVLAVMGETFEGPSARDRFRRRKARQKVTSTWPTEYDASRFAFLPATAYADNQCRLFNEIQRHFLENTIDTGNTWSLWSREEVVRLYNLRLSRFLLETELIRTRRTVTVNAGQASYDLPSDTISVCRVALGTTVLTRVDEWALDNGVVGWEQTSGDPYGYIEDTPSGTLKITLTPTPSANGTLNLILVVNPTPVLTPCSSVPIPAVFSYGVKWGVIADLLSKEGEANDPVRAAYGESRFAEAVELGRLYTQGGKR